jgi:hypothetical protein
MERLRPVGFYNLVGRSVVDGSHIKDAIRTEPHPHEQQILDYLGDGVCAAACGGVMPDPVDPNLPEMLGLDIKSDGVWEWPQYLPYFVRTYHLTLLDEFVEHMKANDWRVPPVDPKQLKGRIVLINYNQT